MPISAAFNDHKVNATPRKYQDIDDIIFQY